MWRDKFIVYKIAICDDDDAFAQSLRDMVAKLLTARDIAYDISLFSSGEMLLDVIGKTDAAFALYFLDIYMAALNGIDTAKAIRRADDSAAIIFTTSSERHVFSGYEVQALQYLLKPIDEQALAAALTVDLKKRFGNRYFVFKSGGMTQKILYDDIEYIESMLKSVRLISSQGIYELYGLISGIENMLPRVCFFRCHRGFIVNFKHVSRLNGHTIVTAQGTQIPISKTYAKATNRAFLNYIGGRDE